jgi:hypothetical protein
MMITESSAGFESVTPPEQSADASVALRSRQNAERSTDSPQLDGKMNYTYSGDIPYYRVTQSWTSPGNTGICRVGSSAENSGTSEVL